MKKIILLCLMAFCMIAVNASQVNYHQSDQLQTFGYSVQAPAQLLPFGTIGLPAINTDVVLNFQKITSQDVGLFLGRKGVIKAFSDFDYGNPLACTVPQKRLIQSGCNIYNSDYLGYRYSPIGLNKAFSNKTNLSTVRHV